MNATICKTVAVVFRWTARILGTTLVVLTVMIAVGEGMPNPFTQSFRNQVGFASLALVLLGILAGWRWEIPGSLISLGGWICFVIVVATSPRGLTVFVVCMALPGLLYLASARLRRHTVRRPIAS